MDEEFTLVSKQKIQEYENTISKLKEEVSHDNSQQFSKEDIQKIVESSNKKTTEEISKKVSELIEKSLSTQIEKVHTNLNYKSTPNKSEDETLKSILKEIQTLQSSTQSIEKSIKTNHAETIKNLKLLVEYLKDTDTIDHINSVVDSIKTHITTTYESQVNEEQSDSHLEIIEKLQEIELFMTNLRVLLSYIKPSNISTSLPPTKALQSNYNSTNTIDKNTNSNFY
ncbi:MAG: hypothetical protein ACLFPL_01970 [Candidatus Nanoarchaeia archaeon]